MSVPVLVRYVSPAPYVPGQPLPAFFAAASATLAPFQSASVCVVGGETKVVRPLPHGDIPPPGSYVKIGDDPWVPYTGQPLP